MSFIRPGSSFGRLSLFLCAGAMVLQAGHGPKPRKVEGTPVLTRITSTGKTEEPQDLTAAILAAHVPDGAGGYTTLPGTGATDGTFVIPSVPKGSYWFQFNSTYVWTQHDKLDLDAFIYGRTGTAAVNPTNLAFTVSGLAPWTATDVLQWYVQNLDGAYGYLGDYGPANEPLPGDTDLAGYNLDWSSTGLPLADTTFGDLPSLTQLRSVASAGETYNTLSGIFQPAALVQTDGLATTLNGAMAPVPQTHAVRMAWRRSLAAGFQTQVNPAATSIFQRMSVHTPPAGLHHGFITATADLVNLFPNPGGGDLDLGNATYGDPFPAHWGKVYSVNQIFHVGYLAPGATLARYQNGSLNTNSVTAPTTAAPLAQAVGPVTGLTIAGTAGFNPQSGLGLTPSLAWSAPALGDPDVYSVAVIRVFAAGTVTRFAQVASCMTRETSMTLPPGLLQAGQSYLFRVRAIQSSGGDPSKVPFRTNRFPFATADVLSAMVSTAP